TGIRYGAVLQIARCPEGEVIAVARQRPRQRLAGGRPGEDVDDVRAVPIDDDRGALVIYISNASAYERIALCGEVGDGWRNIRVTGKPWLHGVMILRGDIDQVVRQQRVHVTAQQLVDGGVGRGRRNEQRECEG